MVRITCPDCNKVIAQLEEDYVRNNPNASDMYIEQLLREHRSNDKNCPAYSGELEICCPHCGEVLATYSEDYAYNNPNGFDMWQDQLLTEHSINCPENDEYQPYDESLLKGKTHFGKEWELIAHHSWFCSSGTIYEQENYHIRWGKGGIDSNDIDIILEEWSIALIEITTRIYKELNQENKAILHDILATIPDELASAIEYELRMKNLLNEEYKVKWYGELMRFDLYRVGKSRRLRRRKKEIEEIIEEA